MLKKLKVRKTNLLTEINNWLKVAFFFYLNGDTNFFDVIVLKKCVCQFKEWS